MKELIKKYLLFCLLLFSSAWTANAAQSGDFTYITNGANATLTGYTGAGGNVVIPDTLDGLPVTILGFEAFANTTNLTDITLPDSVTYFSEGDWTNHPNRYYRLTPP